MDEQNKKSILYRYKDYLKSRLSFPLPGMEAHLSMSPVLNGIPFRGFKPGNDAKSSAVMLLLFEKDSQINIIFTLRSQNLNSHGGQISFPGGRVETDETEFLAALRETQEEIYVEPSEITIIGELSPLFVPPSNSIIYPVVGLLFSEQLDYKANPDEVDEVFSVPISDFYNSELKTIETWKLNGSLVDVPIWNIHGTTPLWGATAMILSEFLTISKEFFNNYE